MMISWEAAASRPYLLTYVTDAAAPPYEALSTPDLVSSLCATLSCAMDILCAAAGPRDRSSVAEEPVSTVHARRLG